MMMRRTAWGRIGQLALVAVCISLTAVSAHALTIDFATGMAGQGGLIQLLGGGNASGTNILIGSMTVAGANANNGTFAVTGGLLNFNTVSNTISIVGNVLGLGMQTLLTGTFGGSVSIIPGPLPEFLAIQGSGLDTKGAGLLAALLEPADTPFAFFGFTLTASFDPLTNSGTAISTDIANNAVPEPFSLLLVGTGLAGLGAVAWRRRRT